ncbi:MAG: DUF1284 domain-containing protein [Thermodesulfovibrionales bacterium]
MPKLRGHHLICLQFFHGEGYNAKFVDNLGVIRESMRDEPIDISVGTDDVCGKCPYLKGNACGYDKCAEEEIGEMDERALRLLRVAPGGRAVWDEISEKLPRIFNEWYTVYCTVCNWREACEKDDYYRQLRDTCLTELF